MKWSEYLKQTDKIESITKQDVIDVANKYFSDNYFDVKKKTGSILMLKYQSLLLNQLKFLIKRGNLIIVNG